MKRSLQCDNYLNLSKGDRVEDAFVQKAQQEKCIMRKNKNSEEGAVSVKHPLHILKQPTHGILLYFSKTFQGCISLPISNKEVGTVAVKENLQQVYEVYFHFSLVLEYMVECQ